MALLMLHSLPLACSYDRCFYPAVPSRAAPKLLNQWRAAYRLRPVYGAPHLGKCHRADHAVAGQVDTAVYKSMRYAAYIDCLTVKYVANPPGVPFVGPAMN